MALGRTARYYRDNPEARKKKNEYQKKYNKSKKERARRADLVKLNREMGTYGNGDGKDVSHRDGKKPILKSAKKNRGSKTDTAGDRRTRGKKK
jgi:uncharacterized phage-associated protein